MQIFKDFFLKKRRCLFGHPQLPEKILFIDIHIENKQRKPAKLVFMTSLKFKKKWFPLMITNFEYSIIGHFCF